MCFCEHIYIHVENKTISNLDTLERHKAGTSHGVISFIFIYMDL